MDLNLNREIIDKYSDNIDKKEILINRSDKENYQVIIDQVKEISSLFPWLSYKVVDDKKFNIKYGIISYFGVPGGNGVTKLLKSICEISQKINYDSDDISMYFFVSSVCPHCPAAFDILIDILKNYNVKTNIYFSEYTPEVLEKMNVLSVPTLIIKQNNNEVARWNGVLSKTDIIKVLKGNGIDKLSDEYFINLLEQGLAEQVASLIIEKNILFDGFKKLFVHEKWSVRLGSIVTAEYLTGLSDELYEELLEYLHFEYDKQPNQIKGDIIYLFSLSSKKEKWIENIEELTEDEVDHELKDAAIEAIEDLRN